MAEIPFRAKESSSLAPACPGQTTGMLFLNPQFRAHLHLGRDFASSISLLRQAECLPNGELYFPWGIHRQIIQVCFVPYKQLGAPGATGEQPPLLRYPARAAWGGGTCHPPLCSASSPFLMLFLLCGLPLKIYQDRRIYSPAFRIAFPELPAYN